jgi:polyisoprenoid-binding protein YceI
MNMKHKINFVIMAAAVFLTACGSNTKQADDSATGELSGEISEYLIDTDASSVVWNGTMVGLYTHEGTVKLSQGTIQVQDGRVVGGSFEVDLSSITPTDANFNPAEGKTPEKLIGHLSSADFFDVANHPKATFSITGGAGGKATGNLTVRGNTLEEAVENVTLSDDGTTIQASGTLTFDRQKYGVAFVHPVKDMIIGNDVELKISLVARK